MRDLDRDLEREDLEDLELERDVDRPRLRDRLREGFARVLPKETITSNITNEEAMGITF